MPFEVWREVYNVHELKQGWFYVSTALTSRVYELRRY